MLVKKHIHLSHQYRWADGAITLPMENLIVTINVLVCGPNRRCTVQRVIAMVEVGRIDSAACDKLPNLCYRNRFDGLAR